VASRDPLSFQGPDGPPVGVFVRPDDRLWLHILLFALTVVSTTLCGGLYFGGLSSPELLERLGDPRLVTEGLKFSLPLLAILFAHEMGHLLAARYHRLHATLPFFIPMPIPFPYRPGTLGAVIRIKQPILHRRQLLDVGAAGPIAGFVIAIPILLMGVGLSEVQQIEPEMGLIYFGEPLAFRFVARVLFFSDLGPGQDILLHPTGWAAWFGLLVTALNLLPFSQLDGGHVGYALLGGRHRHWVWGFYVALVAFGFLWPGWWVWSIIIAMLGPRHPPVLDEAVPLDRRRILIAWLTFLIFVLSVSPIPVEVVLPSPVP
jgi:membrane-associated protease RseP (regulator of RpoE activity)